MKKILIIFFVCFIIFTGCRKKEEAKFVPPVPSNSPAFQNRIQGLQESLRQNPKNLNTLMDLGNIYMDSGRYAEAVDSYQKALDIDQNLVDVRVDMGTCYRSMGNPEKAAEEYRKGISINPGHANAHRNLGVVLAFDLNKKKDAIKEFEQYLSIAPNAQDAGKIRDLITNLKK